MFFGLLVEHFEVFQFDVAALLLFFQFGDQHAELGAPVAHVVLADNLVAKEAQQAHHGIANNGGAQVANVHFFGEIGRGVVDHYRVGGIDTRYAEAFVVGGVL